MIAICVLVWVPLLNVILSPVYEKSHASGIPFDLSTLIVIYTLTIIPILALIHNFFWSKIPLQQAGPPIGPEETIIEESQQNLSSKGKPQNI